MKISSLLENDDLEKLQEQFYSYFKTGYEFEEFLKEYLIKIGLDEVRLTQRSKKDGGIDLTAIRKGVGDFSEIDTTNYFVQAKRYKLGNKVSVNAIRQLKGTIPFGYKGIFITTSSFTNGAIKEAINDISRPIIIIDGKRLIESCIDHEIGFIFKPVFSIEQMDSFIGKIDNTYLSESSDIADLSDYIEKSITKNDVRARIISIPHSIIEQVPQYKTDLLVIVNNTEEYILKINKDRNFLSSVTELLRTFGLLSNDGVITPKNAKYKYDLENQKLHIHIEN